MLLLFAFAFFDTPIGAAVVILAGVGLMMLAPFFAALFKRARHGEAQSSLIAVALRVLTTQAQRRYPDLSAAEALERYLISEIHYGYYTSEQIGSDTTTEKKTPTDQT